MSALNDPTSRRLFSFSIKPASLAAFVLLTACATPTVQSPQGKATTGFQTIQAPTIRPLSQGMASFSRVKSKMLPIIKSACRQAHKQNAANICAFNIKVTPGKPAQPSARMSFDANSQPQITFNHAMLQATQTDDELAMVLAHESSHQILRHIERRALGVRNAAGPNTAKTAAANANSSQAKARKQRAVVAFVAYSQAFELEADRLASQMILRGGYAPRHALQFLDRLPENANRVTLHPKHPARIYEVERITREFLQEEANGRLRPYSN